MNTREKLSAILIGIGIILAVLPLTSNRSLTVKPKVLVSELTSKDNYFTVDQVARMLSTEDSTLRLIDLRTEAESKEMTIPGSVNIPYSDFLKSDPGKFLNNTGMKYIFYSNGDINSGYALAIARGMNYDNTYIMKGGLNEWFNKVMNSTFAGERISARENAIFEARTKSKRMFTEFNSLPDSLKMKFMQARLGEAKKLEGGCE
jgi:rhodanese-related sulfurtransferase